MRRKDFEVTNKKEIYRILEKCDSINLGLCENNQPYVCTLSFGVEINEQLTIYLHCANLGKKIDILKKQPIASFNCSCNHEFIENNEQGFSTMLYSSVAGSGIITFVEENEEKHHALNCIMEHYTDLKRETSDSGLNHITILKYTVHEISGKSSMKGYQYE